MHAHKLLAAGRHAKLLSAYFPFWSFSCTATVEYRGLLGFKDAGSGEVVWREMDDWVTLGQRLQLMPEQHPFMQ
ncbi:chaperone protein dnaJ, partial [Haematococcus lacustris]